MRLRTDLMPHQAAAVEKVLPSRVSALFMEMGTGKTRTAIEVIHRRQARISKVVWFCPVSLKQTIRHEILKHTDSLDSTIHVFDDKTNGKNLPDVFWHIIGIESMSASRRVIFAANALVDDATCVIVDESSYIKGHAAVRTSWITRISAKARYRMILTGTPISQGVVDLFSQFRFLSPKILGYNSFYSFAANHLEYSERFPGMVVRAHNTQWLAAKIQPYTYQVTKDECLELPDKLHTSRYFCMSTEQRYWYEKVKTDVLDKVEEWDSYTIFKLFSRLQQIVCGFLNAYGMTFEHSRVDHLLDIIERIPDQEKIIIWCKYEDDIRQITQAIGRDNLALFYGRLKPAERDREVSLFRKNRRFFLATQATGGHGLTLNEACHVIYYNNTFKYAERIQSEDRCHRIGQTRPVTYVDLVCSDSIDGRIMTAIQNKGSVVDEFKRKVDAVKGNKPAIKEMIKSL